MNHPDIHAYKRTLWQLAREAWRPVTADELAEWSGLDRGNVIVLVEHASPPGAWTIGGGLYLANRDFRWPEAPHEVS